MEVKSTFVNLIMKNYEKHGSVKTAAPHQEQAEKGTALDMVSISPQGNKRLFGELMEHSLKKGLSGDLKDEN